MTDAPTPRTTVIEAHGLLGITAMLERKQDECAELRVQVATIERENAELRVVIARILDVLDEIERTKDLDAMDEIEQTLDDAIEAARKINESSDAPVESIDNIILRRNNYLFGDESAAAPIIASIDPAAMELARRAVAAGLDTRSPEQWTHDMAPALMGHGSDKSDPYLPQTPREVVERLSGRLATLKATSANSWVSAHAALDRLQGAATNHWPAIIADLQHLQSAAKEE